MSKETEIYYDGTHVLPHFVAFGGQCTHLTLRLWYLNRTDQIKGRDSCTH
jgi:hypothetical protein